MSNRGLRTLVVTATLPGGSHVRARLRDRAAAVSTRVRAHRARAIDVRRQVSRALLLARAEPWGAREAEKIDGRIQ
jgi:hypothetical protein